MIESPWFPFIYQYTVGGIVFIAGIILAIKKKALITHHKRDKQLLRQLITGFFIYFLFHAIMTLLSGATHG